MSEYIIQGATLTDIADAIREKKGTSGAIKAGDFASEIAGISGSDGVPYWEGIMYPVQGELVFPILSFTPKTVVVSSVYPSYYFDDTTDDNEIIAMSGFLCTAYYDETHDRWIEVIPQRYSGVLVLSDNSFSFTNAFYKNASGQYVFNLGIRGGVYAADDRGEDLSTMEFDCRIYG